MASNATNGEGAYPKIIAWDYQFAPNAQRTRTALFATQMPYVQCEQPFMLPRPDFAALGITHRRIPVNSIGRDVYLDGRAFIAALQRLSRTPLRTTPGDAAYESYGYRSFHAVLPVVPSSMFTPEALADRAQTLPIFGRPDYDSLRPSALAEMREMLDVVEKEMLGGGEGGPWIGGHKTVGLADVNASWIIKWMLETLEIGKLPGWGKESFPRVYAWVDGFPAHDAEHAPPKISTEEAVKVLLNSPYSAPDIGVDAKDPLGLPQGSRVKVETTDDALPHENPQYGKLVGASVRELVLELDNGVRVHYPRLGYLVRPAS